MAEMTYLQNLTSISRAEILDKYFSYPIPCVLIGRNLTPPEEFLEATKKYDVPVLMSEMCIRDRIQWCGSYIKH